VKRSGDICVLLGGWFWLALLAPALSSAQQQEQAFGESIDVRVVNVEAVVTDAKGLRVPGVAAMDEKGGRAELPTSRLKVALKTPPAAGTYARFHTTIRLRNTGKRLVFTVPDQVNGAALWNDAAFKITPSDKTR
jgi:hypothetical protein